MPVTVFEVMLCPSVKYTSTESSIMHHHSSIIDEVTYSDKFQVETGYNLSICLRRNLLKKLQY